MGSAESGFFFACAAAPWSCFFSEAPQSKSQKEATRPLEFWVRFCQVRPDFLCVFWGGGVRKRKREEEREGEVSIF